METSAFGIFESNAIARYVARQGFLTSGLMGGLPIETVRNNPDAIHAVMIP